MKKPRSKGLGLLITILVVIGLVFIGWANRFNIYNELRLYGYNPPASIVQLADQTTMTPYARKLFYVYHPAVQNSENFNQNCKVAEQAEVLGCTVIYKGIYLYNVQEPELNGVEQVTAAHETLHAIYSQLSASNKKHVDSMVMSAYSQLSSTNPTLKTEYDLYVKSEGVSSIPNEMHSILGTTVATLPSDLEAYYKKYFTDRQTIVNYYNTYEAAFTQRQQAVKTDDIQLNSWQATITANRQTLQTQGQALQAQQAQLNSLRSSNQIAAYNAGVSSYNQAVDSYDNLVEQTKSLISQYNALIVSRNAIAVQENNLIKSISSQPSTITTQ